MAGRFKITEADFAAALEARSHLDSEQWMEDAGVPFEIIRVLAATSWEVFSEKMLNCSANDLWAQTEYYKQAFAETVANAFTIGWDCGVQYGQRA